VNDEGRPAERWSPLATLGWTFLVVAVVFVAQGAVAVAWIAWQTSLSGPGTPFMEIAEREQYDGLMLSVALVVGSAAAVALTVVLVLLRRGEPVRSYLALRPVRWRTIAEWVGIALLAAVAFDLLTATLDREVVPEFMRQGYRTAGILPLFWLAVCVASPVFEEIAFRGFLFAGLERPSPGAAIVVSTLVWTGIHLQYGLYELSIVVAIGVILAAARWRTGSTLVPIAMHIALNTLATIEAAVAAGG